MQTIEQILQDLDEKIKLIHVSKDDLANWKTHRVTQRFLLEAQYAMILILELDDYDDYGNSIDKVALAAARRRAIKDTYKHVLTWDPADHSDR